MMLVSWSPTKIMTSGPNKIVSIALGMNLSVTLVSEKYHYFGHKPKR